MRFKDYYKKYAKGSKKGLTIVELMAVIAILAITSGATLSVFLMVHQVTRDASEVTQNQYNTTQVERFIRNELQVASDVDMVKLADYINTGYHVPDVEEGYEYMAFDQAASRIIFARGDDSHNFHSIYTLSDVNEVTLSVVPIDSADPDGKPYKLFYKITTSHYEYSGGIVLGNTVYGGLSDHSMESAGTRNTLHWVKGSTDNDFVLYFYREESQAASSTT